ncbi:MAG: nuclear transport factor 2 family protein [Candidatus Krumholzibacteria bacterium]|jgi:ketosteroid isomerase-like protein|nr:nuclear transport factor 2 family protein [Candidatus Krumholzibacteria bacterium]
MRPQNKPTEQTGRTQQDATSPATAVAEIKTIIETYVDAACHRKFARLAELYAPDVRAFDAIGALEFRGREAYMKHWTDSMAGFDGEMIFEVHHQEIAVEGTLAFSHSLIYCGGKDNDGNTQASWMRSSQAYRKVGSRWLIVHEHYSLPFDGQTGQMLGNLTPRN